MSLTNEEKKTVIADHKRSARYQELIAKLGLRR